MRNLLVGLAAVLCTPLAVAGCPQFKGELQQGGFIWGKVAPGSRVTLDGEALDILDDGTTWAGFGRDAAATAQLRVEGPEPCTETLAVAARQYNIQRIEGVPQKTVTPSPEHLDRIHRERILVSTAKGKRLQRPDLIRDALGGFQWPATGPISGVYGSQRVYNGTPKSPHYGVDVAMPTGTPVLAPTAGVITLAEPDLFYSGGTIIIDHGYGLSSSMLHLSKVLVEVGQEVRAGDLIGEIGSSGRATGEHLDWRMSWRKHRIDPQLLAPPMPSQTMPKP